MRLSELLNTNAITLRLKAQAKKEALEAVGVKVGKTPSETAQLMREIIENAG